MKLDASKGRSLPFRCAGITFEGKILHSESSGDDPLTTTVVVSCHETVPRGETLSIPGLDCGGCGSSSPLNERGAVQVTLKVPNEFVETGTIGK